MKPGRIPGTIKAMLYFKMILSETVAHKYSTGNDALRHVINIFNHGSK